STEAIGERTTRCRPQHAWRDAGEDVQGRRGRSPGQPEEKHDQRYGRQPVAVIGGAGGDEQPHSAGRRVLTWRMTSARVSLPSRFTRHASLLSRPPLSANHAPSGALTAQLHAGATNQSPHGG